jgi:hypothetical protein
MFSITNLKDGHIIKHKPVQSDENTIQTVPCTTYIKLKLNKTFSRIISHGRKNMPVYLVTL